MLNAGIWRSLTGRAKSAIALLLLPDSRNELFDGTRIRSIEWQIITVDAENDRGAGTVDEGFVIENLPI